MADTNLRVRISADLAEIRQGLGLLRGDLAKLKQSSAQALAGQGTAFADSIKGARRELLGFIGAYASLSGVKLLAGIADEATQLRGRIREAKGDYQAILQLADETRTSLRGTADLYARLERTTRGRVKGQQDLLAITKSVNQAIKLSYTGTAQGEAAVLQLGQALASGKLAGDEFRSISENAPRLMQAIADGMGVPLGAMKDLAKEGKLTSDQIVKALLSQGQALETEYARVPVTIGDALTKIRNSFVDYIGNADAASGTSQSLAAALGALAKNLGLLIDVAVRFAAIYVAHLLLFRTAPAVYGAATVALVAYKNQVIATALAQELGIKTAGTWATRMRAAAGLALAAFTGWQIGSFLREQFEEVELAGIALASGLHAIAVQIKGYFQDAGLRIKLAMSEALNGVIGIAGRMNAAIVGVLSKLPGPLGAAYTKIGQASQRFLAGLKVDVREMSAEVSAANKRIAGEVAKVREGYAQLADAGSARRRNAGSASSGTSDGPGSGDAEAKAKKAKSSVNAYALAIELELDLVQRKLKMLDQMYADGQIGLAAYFGTKRDLLLEEIDLQIAAAQAEAATATTQDAQAKALQQIIKLQRDRAAIGPQVARVQAQAEKELTDQLELLRAKLADLNGGFGNEASERLRDEYEAMLKKLGDSAEGKDLAGKIFNIESAKMRLDEIMAAAQAAIATLQNGTNHINSQAQLGAIGPLEAERQLQALRAVGIEQLQKYKLAAEQALAAAGKDTPQHAAAMQGLAQINTALADAAAAQQKFKNAVADQAVSAIGGFFDDLIDGAKSFKDAFVDMVRNFLAGIAKMLAQEAAMAAVRAALRAWGGGSANGNVFGSSGMQKFAKGAAFALPGIAAFAGGGAFTNSIVSSPTLFTFAGGGQFGVMGEAGPEAVMPLTRGPGGRLGVDAHGAGGGGRKPSTYVLAVGDDQIANAMAGAAGEDIVLMHIRNNQDLINGRG